MDTGQTGVLGTSVQSLVVLVSVPVNAHALTHHHQAQQAARMAQHVQAAHKRLNNVLCLVARPFKEANSNYEQQIRVNLIYQLRANEFSFSFPIIMLQYCFIQTYQYLKFNRKLQ